MSEAKIFYAEAIISDLISDTLNAMYGFDNVFKALAQLEEISENDELDKLKYQQMLTAVIEYYDNNLFSKNDEREIIRTVQEFCRDNDKYLTTTMAKHKKTSVHYYYDTESAMS